MYRMSHDAQSDSQEKHGNIHPWGIEKRIDTDWQEELESVDVNTSSKNKFDISEMELGVEPVY
ncbi:hypothetical protein MAR_021529 [Mya arenaria]|uniref:Uncharacterized protein n=1 Tax=Mya arenaria TaxID=6604 RepID=A0ABY7EAZ8_MYAAR|nr:hypothetical protein MAR_021529 [Mya arenaria]